MCKPLVLCGHLLHWNFPQIEKEFRESDKSLKYDKSKFKDPLSRWVCGIILVSYTRCSRFKYHFLHNFAFKFSEFNEHI